MYRYRNPTPSDHRRFDRLFWGSGGIYDDYRRNGWRGAVASFGTPRTHQFTALGHRWTLHFETTFWSDLALANLKLIPDRLLEEKETRRLQRAGFYDDLIALFRNWGYRLSKLAPPGILWLTRRIPATSILEAQEAFESLDLQRTISRPAKGRRADRSRTFGEMLHRIRRSRTRVWRAVLVEFRIGRPLRACGIPWRTRFDLFVGPTDSCSWFYAWPPASFRRKDWRRVEATGFFEQSTKELHALGYEGYWRPGLFSDPERLAAEFWKETHDPRITRKDFEFLLRWRMPSGV